MAHKKMLRSWKVWLLALGVALGLYLPYASRRLPVEGRQGSAIQWPANSASLALDFCRLMTYNIHRAKGTDGVRDLSRIAEMLRGGDVIALNEVAGPVFFGQPDQAAQLGEALGIGWLFAPNQRRWHMDYFGNALLSRTPVLRWSHEALVYDAERSHSYRNLLKSEIILAGQPVTVFVTHVDRGTIRPTQLQFTLQLFARHNRAVLMGDLNSTQTDPILANFLIDANNIDALSIALGEEDPPDRIDWILLRGLEVLSGGMHPTGASDHPCFWVNTAIADPNTRS